LLLVVDNGSVYTKNLIEFLSKQKIKFTNLGFEKVNLDSLDRFDSFILSGRRSNNKKMNSLNSKIIKHAISKGKPLLGICYGAEMLALTVGGTIKKMKGLQKGQNIVRIFKNNPLCDKQLEVFESHSYEISSFTDSVSVLASSDTCKNEIIQVNNSNIFGTQFHPEMSQDGRKLIEKFCILD